jgi:hypothetical protein
MLGGGLENLHCGIQSLYVRFGSIAHPKANLCPAGGGRFRLMLLLPRIRGLPKSQARQKRANALRKKHRYSITSSARTKIVGGIVRPNAFAVLRFTIKSNLVGCSTGMSPAFTPRKILST